MGFFAEAIIFILFISLLIFFNRFVSGKMTQIYIVRHISELSKVGINYLQVISSYPKFLLTGPDGRPFKYMFIWEKIGDSCEVLNVSEFDLKIVFSQGDKSKTLSNLDGTFDFFDFESHCYTDYGLGEISLEMPVTFCEDSLPFNCSSGKLEITVRKSPLSEITYWIERSEFEDNFEKFVPFKAGDIDGIEIKSSTVQLKKEGNSPLITSKKFISPSRKSIEVRQCEGDVCKELESNGCYFFKLNSSSTTFEIIVPKSVEVTS